MSRTMAKDFEVTLERDDSGKVKGSPLQSKINSFLKEKVATIHDFEVRQSGDTQSATLIYEVDGDSKPAPTDRVFSKVVEAPAGKDFQSKVNQFTGGKNLVTVGAYLSVAGDDAIGVIFYTKPDATEASSSSDEAEAAAPAEAAPEPATA